MSSDATLNVVRDTTERCWCGEVMPARARCASCGCASSGRRRISHDVACRRRRDLLLQQWQRRQEWTAAWRAELGRGYYSDDQVRRELDTLRAEIETLERTLGLHRESAA